MGEGGLSRGIVQLVDIMAFGIGLYYMDDERWALHSELVCVGKMG